MTREEAFKEFIGLPTEEKEMYLSFNDYLGANALCACKQCGNIVEYDKADEMGYCCYCFDCFDCSEDNGEKEYDEEE